MADEKRHIDRVSFGGDTVYALFINDHPTFAFASQAAAEQHLDLPLDELVKQGKEQAEKAEAQGKHVVPVTLAEARARKKAHEAKLAEKEAGK
jgi:hypothetical protein